MQTAIFSHDLEVLAVDQRRVPTIDAPADELGVQAAYVCQRLLLRTVIGSSDRWDGLDAGFQDLIGSLEDALRASLGNRFAASLSIPVLDVPATELASGEAERFEAHQRHGFRFDLTQAPRRHLGIRAQPRF